MPPVPSDVNVNALMLGWVSAEERYGCMVCTIHAPGGLTNLEILPFVLGPIQLNCPGWDTRVPEKEWLRAKAQNWRVTAPGSRDPDTIRILLSLRDLIEAEITKIETANSRSDYSAGLTVA